MIIQRVRHHRDGPHKGKDEVFDPKRLTRTVSKGLFQLAIKKTPYQLNHWENRVFAASLNEVADLVKLGHSLWMTGNLTNQRNLISASQIDISP